jgi:hypothetical protein
MPLGEVPAKNARLLNLYEDIGSTGLGCNCGSSGFANGICTEGVRD